MLWGALAFFLNFVPIIGPLVGMAVFFVAGVAALAWPLPALAPLLLYACIHFFEGQLITPHLVARRFELNPLLVIISLLAYTIDRLLLWFQRGLFPYRTVES